MVERRNLLTLLLGRLDDLAQIPPDTSSEEFLEWQGRTAATLRRGLPPEHPATAEFANVSFSLPHVYDDPSPNEQIEEFEDGRKRAGALLRAVVAEFEDFDDDSPSPVEQGQMEVLAVHEVKALEQVIGAIRNAEQDGALEDLDFETRAEAVAEIETLEVQLHSPKPKRSIVRPALQSLRGILEGAGGVVLGSGLLAAIQQAIRLLH